MIGKWLKEKRENLSLTAQDIKQETKTSSTLISLVETGKRLPSEKFLESYLLVLAKASGFDETLRDRYTTTECFEKWQSKLTIEHKGKDTIYYSCGRKICVDSKGLYLKNIEPYDLHVYFIGYSWSDFADYQNSYLKQELNIDVLKSTPNRLNKKIDLIETLDIDAEVTQYWLEKYRDELKKLIEDSFDELPKSYEKIYYSLTKFGLEEEIKKENSNGIEISQLSQLNLVLDGEQLTNGELEVIATVIEGIRARRRK